MMIDCHNHVGSELIQYLAGQFPYGQQLVDLVAEGGRLGVDRWVVFPMVSNLAMELGSLREGRIQPRGALEQIPYAFENRRMLQEIYDLFPNEGARTIPFVMIDPARETQAQAQALRKLREEYRFYGIKLQPTMIQAPVKELLEGGRMFLELAEEWGIPFLIHSSVLLTDVWAQASDILDVVEATPAVRFCVAHSLRFDRVQLERLAALPHCWFDCSAHRIHCELAVEDSPIVAPPNRRFVSDYTRPERVLQDLATAYPGKLLWGSDSPYYSYVDRTIRLFSTYAAEVECVKALPTEICWEVTEVNTLQYLALEIHKKEKPFSV